MSPPDKQIRHPLLFIVLLAAIPSSVFGVCLIEPDINGHVSIPITITSVGENTFYRCNMTSVSIPNSVTMLRSMAFVGCRSLVTVSIPDTVVSIGDNTFSWCWSLQSLTIPDSVTSIGTQVCYSCPSLSSVVVPSSVVTAPHEALPSCLGFGLSYGAANPPRGNITCFACSGVSSIRIPDTVTRIGHGSFYQCANLTSIHIADSVTSIGNAAFGSTALVSVYVPESVTLILRLDCICGLSLTGNH